MKNDEKLLYKPFSHYTSIIKYIVQTICFVIYVFFFFCGVNEIHNAIV